MAKSVVAFSLEEFDPSYTRVIIDDVSFYDSVITDLGTLEVITGYADFRESKVTDLGNLTTIGRYVSFGKSQIKDLGNLQKIGGSADFQESQVTNLGNLTTIGGNVSFTNSQVTDLGNLTTIGGNVSFKRSKIESLANLTAIGGSADFTNSVVKDIGKLNSSKKYKEGGRTISQTPAPKKDQIKGSDKNKEGSSKDTESAKQINFNEKTLNSIQNKVTEHNKQYPNKKITLASAKAVVRRGMGAYSNTYRPTISGGKPNSRVAWGLARLNAFIYKIINGKSKSGKYSQDDDLINELGYKVAKYEIGGVFHGSSYYFDKFNTDKIGSGIGQQQDGWGIYLTDDKESSKNYGNYIYETTLFKDKNLDEYTFLDLKKPVKKDLVSKIVEALYKNFNKEFDINKFNLYYNYTKNKSLPKVDFNDYELIEFDYSGYLFYGTLSRILGGDKKASLFLLNNGIDGIKRSFENSEGVIYRTDYVIFDENAITIENKEHLPNNYYADGGDIQAYEEAMGISYAEGGEAKPKKVYVSIQLDNTYKKIPNTYNEYFTTYYEKTFEELKNGVLKGVVGVSSSPNNIAEWFISRDCLIVMDYDEFMAINETEIINYYDPYQLMKNNLYLFKRLYANISRYGEQEGSYVFKQTLVKILEKIILEINLEMNLAEGQKLSELYRISRFLSPYETRAFPEWIEKNEIKIESPIDLTNAILDFNKLNDNWLGQGFENSVLTFDELLPVVEKGITNASRVYDSEQEIVLNNRELNIPKNSQLFFVGKDEVGRERESNRDELIEKYNLKELYKVFFVDRQQIQKYRDFWVKKEEEKFNQKIETGKQDLEIKKNQVTNNLIDYFIQHSIDTVIDKVNKEILSYESGSLEFYDSTKDDYEEMNWVHIPLVDELFSKYTEIVEKSWEEIIENKSVNEVNLYSFNVFQDTAYQQLKTYFEQNRDKYEELDNYRNTKGRPSLQLSFFSYDLLKSLYDYEDLPEWIDYKELSKMYLNKMGVEIYRYYDKKDLPLISKYKDGGSVLLAPNGKPSNLTSEQYKLVRTPAFKEFFGDWENDPANASKVVDSNGEPLVVYHGTRSDDFYEFENKLFGYRGFYFTDKKSVARNYGSNIRQFFLNSKNFVSEDMKGGNYSDNEWIDDLVENSEMDNKDVHLLNFIDPLDPSSMERFPISNIYIIFNKSNIKLADGSNTTFDSNNNDIRFDEGGLIAPNGKPSGLYFTEIYNLVRTKEFKNWFGDWEEAHKTKDYEGVSKIIDENGEPLICVHNTSNEFYEFDEFEIGKNTDAGYYGKGFYFTPNVGQSRYGEIELNCFLNIKNPYFKQSSYRNYELNSDELKNQGYDGVVVYPTWIEDFNFKNGVHSCEEVVAYYSEQIKLADGSNTTFDSNNPDIRYAEGGEITLLKNKIKAPFLNKLYGQDVEPSGYYAIEKKTNMFDSDDNYETKKIKYKNPLYIDVDTDTLISWKYELSNKYKAKGKQLTEKLIKEGYDVIITKYPNGDKGEIIVLDTLKLNNNDIRYKTGGLMKRRSKK